MSGYLKNSEWQRRLAGRATVREQLVQVGGGQMELADFMRRYKKLVFSYLHWFLTRHKLVAGEAECAAAAEMIWDELMKALPGKIALQWSQGGVSFRELLREAVHEAYFAWSNPARSVAAVRARMSPDAEDQGGWRRAARSDLLAEARERLKSYQRENESRKNVYYTLFCLWDEDHAQPHDTVSDRLAALQGGRRLGPENFRQSLRRAIETFGRYLGEGVGDWIASHGTVTAENYRQAFEDLDLMDYAMESRYCRCLMGLDIYD